MANISNFFAAELAIAQTGLASKITNISHLLIELQRLGESVAF